MSGALEALGNAINPWGWMVLLLVFGVMPIHVLWYKHKQRPFLSSWLVTTVTYFAVLAPVGVGLAYWPQFVEAMGLTPQQENISGVVAGLVAIVGVNWVWIRFLRFLKSPPTAS